MVKELEAGFFVSAQPSPEDVPDLAQIGIGTIISNRVDGEEPGQTVHRDMAKLCATHGISYHAVPVSMPDLNLDTIEAMAVAMAGSQGMVLAHCKSGLRSALMWGLVRARARELDVGDILQAASKVGFDLSPMRPTLEALYQPALDEQGEAEE